MHSMRAHSDAAIEASIFCGIECNKVQAISILRIQVQEAKDLKMPQ